MPPFSVNNENNFIQLEVRVSVSTYTAPVLTIYVYVTLDLARDDKWGGRRSIINQTEYSQTRLM